MQAFIEKIKQTPLFSINKACPPQDIADHLILLQTLEFSPPPLEYLKFIGVSFVHFASMYVFGMYLSANKDKIDIFWQKRAQIWFFMLATTIADIYFMHNGMFFNGTLSKIFLTILVLGYLKHYDEKIKSYEKLNHWLDVTAKYSFGLFFVHWYFVFAFNQLFDVPKVIPVTDISSLLITMGIACTRYVFVLGMSFLSLYVFKTIIKKLKIDNTRQFIGV